MKKFRELRKESLDDVSSFSHRRLSTILKNPNHPHHSAAKAEMDRRAIKSEGYGPGKKKTDEGAMKRMVTTQSNKADRMASTDKKGLETYKKKVDEISLDSLTKKISNTGMSSTKKAMGADKTKKDLEAMKARLATEETVNEISMTKLRNYSKDAAKDIEQKRDTVRKAMSTGKKKDYDDAQKAVSGLGRRSRGSDMYTDKMTGRSKVKPKMEEKDTHVTKDGRTVKKGLWYYMNKRKQAGTSRPKSAGTVDPKMMKKSQS